MADAQMPAGIPIQGPTSFGSGMIRPMKGAPITVEAVETRIIKPTEGAPTREVTHLRIFRDDLGRVRTEMKTEPRRPQSPEQMVQITDPVAGYVAFLPAGLEKLAYRLITPIFDPRGFVGVGGGVAHVPGSSRNTMALGKKVILGVEFEGSLVTTARPDGSSPTSKEWWISQEIGLIGSLATSEPGGDATIELQRINRGAPDPDLFVIPPDYKVVDVLQPH